MEANFPWYDSPWLKSYKKALSIIQEYCPDKLAYFEKSIDVLRTGSNFKTRNTKNLFSTEKLQEIKEVIRGIEMSDLEKHEFLYFGRLILHNLPYFNALREEFTAFVSESVGKEVKPGYNFLSLYNNLGICNIHMDSPESKWTLDICIDQSSPWPIHFSQVVPWPEDFRYAGEDWQAYIKNDKRNVFSEFTLHPGDSLLFAGSSQWHYRERIVHKSKVNFCQLISCITSQKAHVS